MRLSIGVEPEGSVLGAPIRARGVVVNDSDQPLETANPELGSPPPALGWKASSEAYRIAVLRSFGLIAMTLTDAGGHPVESTGLVPWVTPILGRRTLQPNEQLVLELD